MLPASYTLSTFGTIKSMLNSLLEDPVSLGYLYTEENLKKKKTLLQIRRYKKGFFFTTISKQNYGHFFKMDIGEMILEQ